MWLWFSCHPFLGTSGAAAGFNWPSKSFLVISCKSRDSLCLTLNVLYSQCSTDRVCTWVFFRSIPYLFRAGQCDGVITQHNPFNFHLLPLPTNWAAYKTLRICLMSCFVMWCILVWFDVKMWKDMMCCCDVNFVVTISSSCIAGSVRIFCVLGTEINLWHYWRLHTNLSVRVWRLSGLVFRLWTHLSSGALASEHSHTEVTQERNTGGPITQSAIHHMKTSIHLMTQGLSKQWKHVYQREHTLTNTPSHSELFVL